MRDWKAIAGLAVIVAALWLLYPSRQLGERADPNAVEIFFMGPGGPVRDTMADLVREFERLSEEAHRKDPSRSVYRVISGQNAARNQVEDPTRFLVSVAGGTPPDVIFFDRYAVAEWAARGGFEPLDEYIRRDLADIAAGRRGDIAAHDVPAPQRFFKACWEEGMYKGRIYGIPNSVDNRALYYNKDLLIAAGYKTVGPDGKVVARPPKNWAELAEYAVKLTQHDEKGRLKVIGFPAYYGNSWLYMYGWMNGGQFMSDDRRTCTLNAPRIVEALEFLKRLYDLQGGYPRVRAFQAGFQGDELDPFIQGKIAMKIDGVWMLRHHAYYGPDLNFGVATNPMPQKRIDELKAAGTEPRISWSGGWAYAIPSTAKNKLAAWEFIRFITSDRAFRIAAENDRILAESQGRLYLPNQCPVKKLNQEFYEKYVLGNDRLPRRFKEGYKVFNDLLPYSKFRPVTPVGQLLWNKHRDSAEEVLNADVETWHFPWALVLCCAMGGVLGAVVGLLRARRDRAGGAAACRAALLLSAGVALGMGLIYLLAPVLGHLLRWLATAVAGRASADSWSAPVAAALLAGGVGALAGASRVGRRRGDVARFALAFAVTAAGVLILSDALGPLCHRWLGGTFTTPGRSPVEALTYHTAAVQRRLDEILQPPPGRTITDWTGFFVVYGLLLAGVATLVVLWDTRRGFRSRVGRLIGLSKARAEAIIEGSRGGYFRRQWFGGYLCASPWILGFIVMAGGPMLFSLVMSFCDFDVINPAKLIGGENYAYMVRQDDLFWKSLGNTAFMLLGVPLGMAVSLLMAMLLNAKVRGIALWRTFFYLPAIVPMVAASILWIWILNPQGGFLNRVIEAVGLKGPPWLQDQAWSKPAIILMGLWGAGGGMIIWLAGLKGIPEQLYEAADVDGAGTLQKFWHVTIPQLTPYIFFNLVMGTIGTFQIFGQAFIMTQGGPANSTLFYVYHLFNNAFRYGHMGYAAAMAWFLFVIVFLLTLFQMKLSKRWVHYEAE